jgi:hypothetical protein
MSRTEMVLEIRQKYRIRWWVCQWKGEECPAHKKLETYRRMGSQNNLPCGGRYHVINLRLTERKIKSEEVSGLLKKPLYPRIFGDL